MWPSGMQAKVVVGGVFLTSWCAPFDEFREISETGAGPLALYFSRMLGKGALFKDTITVQLFNL